MSKLIYCKNKSVYKSIDRSLLWNCFITDSPIECKTYLSLYQPKIIILSNDLADEAGDLIKFIKTVYEELPSIFIYSTNKILSSFTDDTEKRQILHADKIPLEIDELINKTLLHYKFQPHLKGYTYIKRALYEGILNDGAYFNIKKMLYSNISAMYLVSESSVERGISFSVTKAYYDSDELKEMFSPCRKSPSNLLFLKRFLILLKNNINNIRSSENKLDFGIYID